jgi:hypothetical protein
MPARRREEPEVRGIERWLFAPGDARRLAALRVGLSGTLAIRLSRGVFAGLAGQPRELYRPVSFMHAFGSMPGRRVVIVLQVVGVGAAVIAAAGLRPRFSLPVAWVAGAVLAGMTSSTGKITHNDVLLLLALVPLLPAPTSDAWSVDSVLRRRSRPDGVSARYGWPVRTAMVVVAGAYFFIGLWKLVISGPAWFASGNLRWILYTSSDGQAVPNHLGLFIADRPWLAHVLAGLTMAIELGFPLVLWRPRAAWIFVPGVMGLHVGIWATMHLDYWAWVATVLVVFVNWPAVADRMRRGRERRLPSFAPLPCG